MSVRIHEFGGGVSQLIGTGGRDLSEKIGGLMMLDAIGMLENDPQTEIIVLISKPPAPAVARKVLERARACRKPVVACFLGRGETPVDEQGLQFARGSKEAALKAVMLSGVKQEHLDLHTLNQPLIADVRARLQPQQKYIRGLFCGGTLCDETLFAVMENMAMSTAISSPILNSACKISTAASNTPSSILAMMTSPTASRIQ